MSHFKRALIIFTTAVVFCFGATQVSLAENGESGDLNNFSCKEIMRLSGEQRDIAIAFIHGFLLGKSGVTNYETQVLSDATDDFTDVCLDNPQSGALTTMEEIMDNAKQL